MKTFTKNLSMTKGPTMRRWLAALLLPWALGACSSLLPAPAPSPAIYDLGAPGAAVAAPIRAVDVDAPDWLDSNGMLYRLGDPQRVQRFTEARWAASPGNLLEERLRQRLVPKASGATLYIGLESFEQRFSTATQSEVCVRVRAKLGERQQVFEIKRPGGTDAASGARALATASDALIEQMLAWAASAPTAQ
ncbi:ABC-type transport auxiliary lipoprotein family protein [Burkholderiaceae bacterium UC74_6]